MNSHGLTFKDIQEHVLKFSRRKFSFRDAYFRRILKSVSDEIQTVGNSGSANSGHDV